MSDLTLTWAEVHACLAAKYGKRAFDALHDLLCATIGSDVPDLAATAADDIVDHPDPFDTPISAAETLPNVQEPYPCPTHLLPHSMTVDEAIDTLGTVHK